jgi:hypothetical protein
LFSLLRVAGQNGVVEILVVGHESLPHKELWIVGLACKPFIITPGRAAC